VTDSVMLWSAAKGQDEQLDGIKDGRFALQFSLDGETGWDFIDGVDGAYVPLTVAGPRRGDWAMVETLWTTDVCFKVVTVLDDGTVADFDDAPTLWKYGVSIKAIRIGAWVETAGTIGVDPIVRNVWVEFHKGIPAAVVPENPDPPAGVDNCDLTDEWAVARGLLFWHMSGCSTEHSLGAVAYGVDALEDLTGNGFDLGLGNSAVSGSNVTKYETTGGAAIAQVNGYDPVSFKDAWLPLPTDVFDGVTEGEYWAVLKANNGDPASLGDRDYFHQLGPSDDTRLALSTGGGANSGQIREDIGSSALHDTGDITGSLASWFVYRVRFAAGHYRIYVNGVLEYSSDTNTVAFNAAPKFGNRGQNSQLLWLEDACHNVLLTTEEAALNLATLQARYGI
jgi:hypothetical protein